MPNTPDSSLPAKGGAPASGAGRRGFASMDPERRRQIASQGGKAAHASGKAHQFSTAEAREAGRKGGTASRRNSQAARTA